MKTRVQKWGHSLALRIPKAFAEEAGLGDDSAVDLSLVHGQLIIRPVGPVPPKLKELLRKVTSKNLHGAWDTGPAVGGEIW